MRIDVRRSPNPGPPAVGYAFGLLLIAITTLARHILTPLLGAGLLISGYLAAVAVTAVVGGSRPAAVATILSIIASRLWSAHPPGESASHLNVLFREIYFLAICGFIIWLIRALRIARDRAQVERDKNALILSSITDAVATMDHEWRITYANPKAEELFRQTGRDPKGVIGSSIWELYPEAVGSILEKEYRRAMRENVPVAFEIGSSQFGVWLAVHAYPSEAGLTSLSRDITELRRAGEMQQKLAAVVESTDDAIITTTIDGQITTWNQGAERMFGCPAKDAVGDTLFQFIPTEDVEEERAVLERIAKGEHIDHYETRRRRRDGTLLDVSIIVSPLRDSAGNVIGSSAIFRDVTERRKAEEALRLQREWFSVTLASIGDGVIATDPTGRITFVNPIAEAITGWKLDDAMGLPLSEVFRIVNKSTQQPISDPIGHVMRDGSIVGLASDAVLIRRDGTRVAIEDSAAPIRNSAGAVLGVVMVFHDVTARREAEDQLRSTEQRLRLATKTGKVGIWDWDVTSNHITWSESLYAIYGVDPSVFVPTVESFANLLHPDNRELVTGRIRHALDHDSQYEAEFRAVRSDGNTIWLYSNAAVLREHGKPVRMIGATVEMTERKLAEAQLQESRNYFQSVVETSPSLVVITDTQGTVVLFNGACEERTGYRREDVLGRSLKNFQFASPWDIDDVETFRQTAEAELREPRASRWRTITGEDRWIEWRSARLPGKTEDEYFLLRSGVDITDRRRAEEELAAARDAAEAANRAKDRFLATLSHELRTPLTPALMISAELARSPEVPEEYRRHFEVIRSNVELEARLIDDLLDLTRIAAGKLNLKVKPCDAHGLVHKVAGIFTADIAAKQIELTLDLAATETVVCADEVRLQQVFWNVLKNALKFTRRGGSISIHTSSNCQSFRLDVRDSGIGIAPEDVHRIFDAFVQVDDAIVASAGGLGLGLSICSLLMKEQAGRIWVSSEGRGRGSTFHIEVPLDMSSVGAEPKNIPQLAGPGLHCRILIVEDHEQTRATLSRLLAQRGHEVESADCIATARITAQKSAFDLVISDVGLPDGDGRTLMRQLYGHLGMPGIALSGYGTDTDIRNSIEAGFSAHLTKPVDLEELDRAISEVMRGRAGQIEVGADGL